MLYQRCYYDWLFYHSSLGAYLFLFFILFSHMKRDTPSKILILLLVIWLYQMWDLLLLSIAILYRRGSKRVIKRLHFACCVGKANQNTKTNGFRRYLSCMICIVEGTLNCMVNRFLFNALTNINIKICIKQWKSNPVYLWNA